MYLIEARPQVDGAGRRYYAVQLVGARSERFEAKQANTVHEAISSAIFGNRILTTLPTWSDHPIAAHGYITVTDPKLWLSLREEAQLHGIQGQALGQPLNGIAVWFCVLEFRT
jgi:hypothetical protein